MKDSFVFYRSFYESIKSLDKDLQIEIYTAICEYSLNGIEMDLSPVSTAIFRLIKPNIDNATKRYKEAVENGKRGGKPSKIKDEDILRLREEGKKNKEIAEMFGVTEKAIERRITAINRNTPTNPTNPTNLNVDVYVNDYKDEDYNYNEDYNDNYNDDDDADYNVNDNFKNKEYYSSSNNIIISYIENNFNSKLSEIEINTIKKWKHIYDNDVIKYAVDKACLSNVKSLAYVIGILKNWNDKGYKDIEDCQNEYIDISDLKDGVIINDDDWMNE